MGRESIALKHEHSFTDKMKLKIFISWSGDNSRKVAEALNEWIPRVIQNAETWMSSRIQAGKRWSDSITKQLEDCQIGIICLTPDNLTKPWICFEAGALAKTMELARVCPYMIHTSAEDLPSPLRQFQAVPWTETGTRNLLYTINDSLGEDSLRSEILNETFNVWWPKLEAQLIKIQESDCFARPDPEVITDPLDRTCKIIKELKSIKSMSSYKETIYHCAGSLSTFAISEDEVNSYKHEVVRGYSESYVREYHATLLEERQALVDLAQSGFKIKCIIHIPEVYDKNGDRNERLYARLRKLHHFLTEDSIARNNVSWAESPSQQNNVYVVGKQAFFESFKEHKGFGYGYNLTLCQRRPEAMASYIALYEKLFSQLRIKSEELAESLAKTLNESNAPKKASPTKKVPPN